MNHIEAMKQALEALVAAYQGKDKTGQVTDAITAIREALAEQPTVKDCLTVELPALPQTPEQISDFIGPDFVWREHEINDAAPHEDDRYCVTAHDLISAFARLAEQPAQQQEPVAVARVDDLERGGRVRALAMGLSLDAPLYTSPPANANAGKPWVGLTDEEVEDLYFDGFSMSELKQFARAIEAKLLEKNA